MWFQLLLVHHLIKFFLLFYFLSLLFFNFIFQVIKKEIFNDKFGRSWMDISTDLDDGKIKNSQIKANDRN